MTTRTVKFYGFAVGTTATTATATYNGSQIFSGEIVTLPTAITNGQSPIPDDVPIMFTMELPMDASGNVPMTIASQGNPLTICEIEANYCNVDNYPGNGSVSSGATGYCNIYYPRPPVDGLTDARSNVTIDGVSQIISLSTRESLGNLFGTWWWSAASSVAITYDLCITPGLE